ncbi:alpha/beta hydrolase fold family protein [Metarhizium guizhouense ARSEF 977]|uniref:Alpha/beta hydrolase fold family protein n=1 Tax=Metarhizium guizhouense (strain ARSEF 977) TaxID=1276136 RepID=A0A0B4GQC8_METGA|nr:alpha/beta hydrolase fold family protein [Metarhizium guizhouense ARSEF 977]
MSSIVSSRHSLTRRSVTVPPGIADIHLIWVVKSIQHSAWLKKKLQALHDVTSQPGSTVRLSISLYHTEAGSTEATSQQEETSSAENTESMPTWWTISLGRPDLDSVFQGLKEQHAVCDVGVGLCGPNEMVRRARNVAVGASSTTSLFHLEDEVSDEHMPGGHGWRRVSPDLNATPQDEVTSSLAGIWARDVVQFSKGTGLERFAVMVLQRRWVQRVLEEKLKALEESRNPVAAPKEKPTRADSLVQSHGDPTSPSQVNELNSCAH